MVPAYPLLLRRASRLVVLSLLAPLAGRAQAPTGISRILPPPGPPPAHWQPSIYLDNRNPFEDAAAVRVIGLNVGVTPPGWRFRLGLGAYTLRRSYSDYYVYVGKGKNRHLEGRTPELTLRYFTPNVTYTLFTHRFVEVNVPVDIGVGGSHYTETDPSGQVLKNMHDLFIPVEGGVGVLLKPTRWVGVSGGVGYRRALGDFDFEDDFNGWYYYYRLSVFVGPVWHDVRDLWRRRHAPPPPSPPLQEEAEP